MFGNPFRSSGGASLLLPAGGNITPRQQTEVTQTLLRSANPANTSGVITNSPPLLADSSTNGYNSTTLNPYFRFQTMQRLKNLVTTRSNVYAIWVTIGYFEVTIRTPDRRFIRMAPGWGRRSAPIPAR